MIQRMSVSPQSNLLAEKEKKHIFPICISTDVHSFHHNLETIPTMNSIVRVAFVLSVACWSVCRGAKLTPEVPQIKVPYEPLRDHRGHHGNGRPGPTLDLPWIRKIPGNVPLHTTISGQFVHTHHTIVGTIDPETKQITFVDEFTAPVPEPKAPPSRDRRLGSVSVYYGQGVNKWQGRRHFWEGGYAPVYIEPGTSAVVRAQLGTAMKELQASTPLRFRIIENIDAPTEFSDETLRSNPLSPQEMHYLERVEKALNTTECRNKFTSCKQPGYIRVVTNAEGRCVAHVGKQENLANGNYLTLSDTGDCGHKSTMHELLHNMGYNHEQSRLDRDEYVTINRWAVESDQVGNYNQNEFGYDVHDYDYASIMHYGMWHFLNDTYKNTDVVTMEVNKDKFNAFIQKHHFGLDFTPADMGSVPQMSKLDLESIRTVYKECKSALYNEDLGSNTVPRNTISMIESINGSYTWDLEHVGNMLYLRKDWDDQDYSNDGAQNSFLFNSNEMEFSTIHNMFTKRNQASKEMQTLSITLKDDASCVDAFIVRWRRAPTGQYEVLYEDQSGGRGAKSFVVDEDMYVREKVDIVSFASCKKLSTIVLVAYESHVTSITNVELVAVQSSEARSPVEWVEYPWGPCTRAFDEGNTPKNEITRSVHCRSTQHPGLCVSEEHCESLLGRKPEETMECGNQVAVAKWFEFAPDSFGTNIVSQQCHVVNHHNGAEQFKFDPNIVRDAVELGQFFELSNEKCARMCEGYNASATWGDGWSKQHCVCFNRVGSGSPITTDGEAHDAAECLLGVCNGNTDTGCGQFLSWRDTANTIASVSFLVSELGHSTKRSLDCDFENECVEGFGGQGVAWTLAKTVKSE